MSKLSAIGGAVVSVVSTTAGLFGDTRALLYTDKDFARLYTMMKGQAVEYADLHKKISPVMEQQQTRREIVLDSLGLGARGFLGQLFGWQAPEELQRAYSLACPDLAAQTSLQHAVQSMNDVQLNGFANLLKGKLFELRYAEYLNDGHLPEGFHAELAASANQAGWDIAIINEQGQIDELLQLKATESADYISHALERYPYIDVVTTEEVYSHATMGDMADHLINSGISNDELSDFVQEQILNAQDDVSSDFFPSIIPYAIIAFSVAMDDKKTDYQKGKDFGRRSTLSYVCHSLGVAAAAFTHTWWLGPVVSIGSRASLGYGHRRKLEYQRLKDYVLQNDTVLQKMRKFVKRYAKG
jgi:hypothetical protein